MIFLRGQNSAIGYRAIDRGIKQNYVGELWQDQHQKEKRHRPKWWTTGEPLPTRSSASVSGGLQPDSGWTSFAAWTAGSRFRAISFLQDYWKQPATLTIPADVVCIANTSNPPGLLFTYGRGQKKGAPGSNQPHSELVHDNRWSLFQAIWCFQRKPVQ